MSFGLPMCLASCPHNAINALAKRHLLPPVNKATHIRNPFVTHTELRDRYQSLYADYWNHHNLDEWKTGKGIEKIKSIEKSHAFDTAATQMAESFLKKEVVIEAKKARLIQGNKNERTAYAEPIAYRAAAHALKHCFDEPIVIDGVTFQLVYTAGHNHDAMSDMVSDWIMAPGYLYFDERDGKNWDASMQEILLRAEADVYSLVNPQIAADFILRCTKVWGRIRMNGFTPSLIRYVTAWKRLSGDWNTSAGNTIISMMIVITAILSLPTHIRPHTVRGLFMGDDYLGFYYYDRPINPNDLAEAMNHGEKSCGITPERAIFNNPMDVSYISMGLWPRRCGGYQFVPHPARQLSKLFWTVRNMQGRDISHQRTALAVAFRATYAGFPLMERFLKRHMTERNPKYTLDEQDYYFHTTLAQKSREVDWKLGFQHKYDLPYTCMDWQLPLTATSGVEVWYHPVHIAMLKIETQDPAERRGVLGRPQ